MARKERRLRMPRGAGATGVDVETAAQTRIDAVTAESLIPGRYVEIVSPDGSLRLYYNCSTLIRIATDKGGFMQPPHFREPMSAALQKEIERLEGRTFWFEARDAVEGRGSLWERDEETGGLNIHHRHVYFDQIIDEFYLLNPAEVYVCPVCYEHYITTRYLPHLQSLGYRAEYVNDGETAVVDPLDVFGHMMTSGGEGTPTSTGVAEAEGIGEAGEASRSVLVHIVFRRALAWKRHMSSHHDISSISSVDYRLRDVLCSYYNAYNHLNDEKYEAKVKAFGSAKRKLALTQQRYWYLNARYNRMRYNRVVEVVEGAEANPQALEESAFANENIAHHFNPLDEGDSDFICDDDDYGDDESGSDSSDAGSRGASVSTGDDDESSSSSSECADQRQWKRRRASSSRVSTSSMSDSTASSSDSSSDCDVTNGEDSSRALYRRGLLAAPRPRYDIRLTGDDRCFMESAEKRTFRPAALYDPVMNKMSIGKTPPTPTEEVDWANIGEELPVHTTTRIPIDSNNYATDITPAKDPLTTASDSLTYSGQPIKRLSLDDEE